MKTFIIISLIVIFIVIGGLVVSRFIAGKENSGESAQELVPITNLASVPWLGELKDRSDLAEKFDKEKAEFTDYIQHDLQEAAQLKLSYEETGKMVNLLGSEMKKETVQETVIPDKTVFKSMGWKSQETNEVMRTANPVLEIGRETAGFPVKVTFNNWEVEYVFLKEYGSLGLQSITPVVPPEAKNVPPAVIQPSGLCLLASVGYPTLDAWRRAGCLNTLEKAGIWR